MKRKLLSLLLAAFLLFQQTAFADTFIVTSNADSGPGTLREAIAMASNNGTALMDFINFNLTDLSEAGRTIILHSPLTLTSRITIDASLQPGNKFGVSDSRIKIVHDGTSNFSQGLILPGVEAIELYGLYFSDFLFGDPNPTEIRCVIYIPGFVRNIKIGASGKGNVFYRNAMSIANRYS
ncbi:MAG: hypothetical protein WDO71_12160 [Bacteroidota bacterium]